MNYTYIYTYSLVLDRTVQSGPTISGTGSDCGPKEPDHTVRSFLQSPFSSDKKTGLNGPVSLKPDRTAVWGCWTVQSSLFISLQIRPRSGPDRTVASLSLTIPERKV